MGDIRHERERRRDVPRRLRLTWLLVPVFIKMSESLRVSTLESNSNLHRPSDGPDHYNAAACGCCCPTCVGASYIDVTAECEGDARETAKIVDHYTAAT